MLWLMDIICAVCKNKFYFKLHKKNPSFVKQTCSKECSYKLRIKNTDQTAKGAKVSSSTKGPKNHQWLGEEPGYDAVHTWIRRNFTAPKRCQRCGQAKKLDLASKRRIYSRDLSEWIWLCRWCHWHFDISSYKRNRQGQFTST